MPQPRIAIGEWPMSQRLGRAEEFGRFLQSVNLTWCHMVPMSDVTAVRFESIRCHLHQSQRIMSMWLGGLQPVTVAL